MSRLADHPTAESVPPDHPTAESVPPGHLTLPLRIGVAAYCAGTGYAALRFEPAAFSMLFTGLDLSSPVAAGIVTVAASALLVLVPISFVRRCTPLCLLASAWVLTEIAARWYQAGRCYELAPLAMALRLCGPIALLLAWRGRISTAMWSLRLAAVATFAAHGIEALDQHPDFVDYLIAAPARIGLEISESAAVDTLLAIGIVDLLVAAIVLLYPVRAALLYMVAWGGITALARVVHSGSGGLSDCLLRTIHATGPLAVLLWLRYVPAPTPRPRTDA